MLRDSELADAGQYQKRPRLCQPHQGKTVRLQDISDLEGTMRLDWERLADDDRIEGLVSPPGRFERVTRADQHMSTIPVPPKFRSRSRRRERRGRLGSTILRLPFPREYPPPIGRNNHFQSAHPPHQALQPRHRGPRSRRSNVGRDTQGRQGGARDLVSHVRRNSSRRPRQAHHP